MRFLIKIIMLLFLSSCASLPKEAPLLSQKLGNQIQEIENSHISLVHVFFNNEREKVRGFIDEEWLPVYVTNFFQNPAIDDVWQQIVASGSEENRLQFIVRTIPQLQQEINQKHQELIEPLNRLENQLIIALRNKYANAKSINNTLTSFLYSASEVGENRQRYLELIGISEEETNTVIDQTALLTEQLVETAENIQDIEKNIQEYEERLNELLSTF